MSGALPDDPTASLTGGWPSSLQNPVKCLGLWCQPVAPPRASFLRMRFRGRRLRISIRLLPIPLLIAVITIIVALLIAVPPHAVILATD